MRVDGRTVARTTANDVEEAKRKLYNTFFRLPNSVKPVKKPRRK